MVRFLILWLVAWLGGAPALAAEPPNGRFAGWAAAIVQADWRDSRGRPIDAFDNARRDLAAAFLEAGFPREHLVDVSLRTAPPEEALRGVATAMARGDRGCLLYFTSHGAPDHMVFGEAEMTSDVMANLVRRSCGARPTVVIVSACYSGQFVDALEAPNRMVLTAARRDRTSFGCGADERYPWFDGCVLETLPGAADFLALAAGARACVARKEAEAGVMSPSEPQLFVGSEMQLRLPTLRFGRPTP